MRIINLNGEYIELRDDGTYAVHKVRFVTSGDITFRIDKDNNGKEIPSVVIPKALVTIDKATGNISDEKRGFQLENELSILPVHPDSTKKFIHLLDSAFPDDYESIDSVTKKKTRHYRYEKTQNKLVKKI